MENIRQSEFHACFGENVDQNCNAADEEEVNLDGNYDHFSQLRANKKVNEVRHKRPLQVAILDQQ